MIQRRHMLGFITADCPPIPTTITDWQSLVLGFIGEFIWGLPVIPMDGYIKMSKKFAQSLNPRLTYGPQAPLREVDWCKTPQDGEGFGDDLSRTTTQRRYTTIKMEKKGGVRILPPNQHPRLSSLRRLSILASMIAEDGKESKGDNDSDDGDWSGPAPLREVKMEAEVQERTPPPPPTLQVVDLEDEDEEEEEDEADEKGDQLPPHDPQHPERWRKVGRLWSLKENPVQKSSGVWWHTGIQFPSDPHPRSPVSTEKPPTTQPKERKQIPRIVSVDTGSDPIEDKKLGLPSVPPLLPVMASTVVHSLPPLPPLPPPPPPELQWWNHIDHLVLTPPSRSSSASVPSASQLMPPPPARVPPTRTPSPAARALMGEQPPATSSLIVPMHAPTKHRYRPLILKSIPPSTPYNSLSTPRAKRVLDVALMSSSFRLVGDKKHKP